MTTIILTIEKMTRLFANHVYKLHGIPFELLSGSDAKNLGTFWQELQYLLDIPLAMSTSFHLQINDQT